MKWYDQGEIYISAPTETDGVNMPLCSVSDIGSDNGLNFLHLQIIPRNVM